MKRIWPLLIAVLLAGCGGQQGAPASPEPLSSEGGGSVPEAYLAVERPERRGEGTPAYWPPNYQGEEPK